MSSNTAGGAMSSCEGEEGRGGSREGMDKLDPLIRWIPLRLVRRDPLGDTTGERDGDVGDAEETLFKKV